MIYNANRKFLDNAFQVFIFPSHIYFQFLKKSIQAAIVLSMKPRLILEFLRVVQLRI